MVGWAIFIIIKSIEKSGVNCNYYTLLYMLKFVNWDSFLGYRLEYVHMSNDYYNFNN